MHLLFLVGWMAAAAVGAADEHYAYQRWAIVSSKQLQQDGFPDLLTAELSRTKEIELVERDRLAAVTKELELSSLAGSATASERLKLGRLLGAEALVLLTVEEREKKRSVRLVVSECIYGARLRTEWLPYDPDQREQLADKVAQLVLQTRRHFSGGIRQLIGVPHFVSKNLTYEHNHLQAGYAHLIENALASVPGVAVIETEEAQAIGRELQIGASDLKDRVVPMFVNGEFEMGRSDQGKEPTVHLTIRLFDGKRTLREIDRKDLSAAQVVELLTGEIPQLVVRLAKTDQAILLSRDEQVRALLARANAFAEVGAWEHAVGLREAALLLRPDDLKLRIRLFREYGEWQKIHKAERFGKRRYRRLTKSEQALWATIRSERIAIWRNSMVHAKALIDCRRLGPNKASGLLCQVFHRHGFDPDPLMPPEVNETLEEFFWQVVPQLPKLDERPPRGRGRKASPRGNKHAWVARAIYWLFDMKRGARWAAPDAPFFVPCYDDRETLDDFYRFLTEVVPHDSGPISAVAEFLNERVDRIGGIKGMIQEKDTTKYANGVVAVVVTGRFPVDELRAFYRRLIDSDQPVYVYYGRLGLLGLLDYKNYHNRRLGRPDQSLIEKELTEARELQAMAERNGWENQRRYWSKIMTRLSTKSKRTPWGLHRPRPPNVQIKKIRVEDEPPHEPMVFGRLTFELVSHRWPGWGPLQKCSDSMDMICGGYRIYLMTTKDIWKEVFRVEKGPAEIRDVQWDGENFWLCTAEKGIVIISPEGTVVDRISVEDGLPPYNPGEHTSGHPGPKGRRTGYLQLHPVERGKCLALGAFGPQQRRWAAMVSRKPDIPQAPGRRVHVFYKAIKLFKKKPKTLKNDLEMVFDAGWIKEYQGPSFPGQRLLLVGRNGRRRPLAIDLKTLRVFMFPVAFFTPGWNCCEQDMFVCPGGEILWNEWHFRQPQSRIRVVSPPRNGGNGPWVKDVLLDFPKETSKPVARGGSFGGAYFIPYQEKVLFVGRNWYFIDPKTLEYERLTDAPLPLPHEFRNAYLVPSAHYGLITQGLFSEVWRVVIGDAVPSETPVNK